MSKAFPKPMAWIARALIVLVIAWAIYTFVDAGTMWANVRRAGYGAVITAFLLSLLILTVHAYKLSLVLPSAGFLALVRIALSGQFYSIFFFGQISGEAAKIYLVAKTSGKIGGAVVSILADRITSLLGLLITSIVGFAFSPSPYPPAARTASVVFLILVVCILVFFRHHAVLELANRVASAIESARPYLQKIGRLTREAVEEWLVLVRNTALVLFAVFIGAGIHCANALLLRLLAAAVGIDVSYFDWIWIVGLMSIAGFIPITIGQIAVQGTMVGLLELFGVRLADSLALSVLLVAVNSAVAVIGGVVEWRRMTGLRDASVEP